jgi:Mg-chelatase subunit ChlD
VYHRTHFVMTAALLSAASVCGCRTTQALDPATSAPTAQPAPVAAGGPASAAAARRPNVDIVFALDTTGSMGGLLAGAKAKIWEIARHAQEGQPAPDLRVGLVAYRDVGDEYVTRVLDLTSDMDKVYSTLSEFQANGGGDGPEHVLKGLHDAVDGVHWAGDPDAVKIVYLVGDMPPHFDYQDGITMDSVMADAAEKGVRVSAIRCGGDPGTLAVWTKIAQRTDGEVATIEQTGGVVAATTPYDAELARLNAELAKTEVHWGSAAERVAADKDVEKSLSAPRVAQADRAAFYAAAAGASAAPTKQDLASTPKPAASVSGIPVDQLPDEMQKMSRDERVRFVEQKQREREAILARVRAASTKRAEYLRSSTPAAAPTAFDSKVYDSLRKAGAKKGISF